MPASRICRSISPTVTMLLQRSSRVRARLNSSLLAAGAPRALGPPRLRVARDAVCRSERESLRFVNASGADGPWSTCVSGDWIYDRRGTTGAT
jgi:hypothetical protein